MTRQRHFFPDHADVAKVWVWQGQEEGWSRKKKVYFNGPTIYSYGSHFPMARIIDVPQPCEKMVLVNDDSYSVTTGSHQWSVHHAIRARFGTERIFNVNTHVLRDWGSTKSPRDMIYADREERFKDALNCAAKPRIRHHTRFAALQRADLHTTEANRFAALFGDAVPFPQTEADALASAFYYIINNRETR